MEKQQETGLLKESHRGVDIRDNLNNPADTGATFSKTLETFLRRPIPQENWWSCFGGIAFFLFLVQAATGILLMFFYIPADPEAHRTVLYLSGEVPFGWFFRTVHHWAGITMMISISIHVMRVIVKGAYQKPRDLNWIVGSALFFLTAGFFLTGDLLPWTPAAYWSAVWWTDLVGRFPVVGHQILLFLRGGENVTGTTITRFYVFHVFALPALTTIFMIIHFTMIRKLGLAEPM